MCKTKQVLLLSTNLEVKAGVEKELNCGINVLTTLYNMSDVVESTAIYGYDVLVLDSKAYPINEDILSLFKKKAYYTPRVIVLADKAESKKSDFAKFCGYDDLSIICSTLEELKAKKESEFPFNNTLLRESIASILANAGLNQKYKGFRYLTDIVYRIIHVDNVCKSFKKAIYPHVGRLYNTSPESIERDVRNIINISRKYDNFLDTINFNENYNPTTRNVVNHLVMHVKSLI